jgi:excinuclease ABC subunit C
VSRLRIEMDQAAEELLFERAATLRNQIQAIEKVVEKQKVVSSDYIDSDVIAMARTDGEACLQVFFIRNGKLIGREYFLMEGAEETPDASVISDFIKQFYNQSLRAIASLIAPGDREMQIIANG